MKFLAVGTAFLAMALAAPTDKDYKGDGKYNSYPPPKTGYPVPKGY